MEKEEEEKKTNKKAAKYNIPKPLASLLRKLGLFVGDLPGTPAYWKEQECDLFAMIMQNGPPTLWFTCSAAEHF